MHNFSINQRFKKIKYFDSFDYLIIFWLICLRSYMTEKIQKCQIIKFDSFDFLIILISKKNFYRQTDRQTDRQTFGLIEATSRRLKRWNSVPRMYFCLQKIFQILGSYCTDIASFHRHFWEENFVNTPQKAKN